MQSVLHYRGYSFLIAYRMKDGELDYSKPYFYLQKINEKGCCLKTICKDMEHKSLDLAIAIHREWQCPSQGGKCENILIKSAKVIKRWWS